MRMKMVLRFGMGLLWIGIGVQRIIQQSYPLAILFLAGGVLFVYAGWRSWKVRNQ